ncbi:Rne/Rng family ribonuclease [Stella sp.]|uniref:Rne/Rng family ribonuclease n=1 Tax=Stella sp. TaxID=2912054 RepID=UPI0035B1B197
MAKRMLIDATHPEETRVVILSGSRLEEFDFETSTKKQVKGNIYLAKVTRVEPSLQAAFVEYGGNRHGFLAFSEIHPDYYRIPVADREALLAEQAAEDDEDDEFEAEPRRRQRRPRRGERRDEGAAPRAAGAGEPPAAEPADDAGWDHRPADERDEAMSAEAAESARGAGDDAPAGDGAPTEDEASSVEGGTRPPPAMATAEGLHVPALRSPPAGEAGADTPPAATPDGDAASEAAEPSEAVPAWDAVPAAGEPRDVEAEPAYDAGTSYGRADDDRTEPTDAAAYAADEDSGAESGDEQGEPAPMPTAEEEAERSEAAAAIETLGGDELEDVRRRRQRSTRQYKIQEVVKRRQILLVQVTKEERGNKGAALTTFLSLAGRYCVLMPNAGRSGGGVSRKIVNPVDRRRLKSLIEEMQLPDGMSVIVRTAGSERSRAEIKRDLEYLLRLWDEIRELTMQSTAPALVYEEGKLIKRAIRDLYSRDIEEILVEGEDAYREAKDFMRMLMPSHAKRVQPYRDPGIPLFNRFQIDQQIDAIHSPVVQLKSGGYIVINPTEALVAIDVNSGRSTRERNIEETAYRTNLEAADEIARQLRLRDLAGLIVIDFIDMEEGRNQHAVERRLKEAMKADRARIQIGRISPFGLLELSRQRLRPSIFETSTQPCPHCGGTGHIRSTESTALHVLRAIEEEGLRRRSAEIRVTVPTPVALYILNQKRAALSDIERRYAFEVFIDRDDALIPPDYRLERLRVRAASEAPPLPAPPPIVPEEDDLDEVEDEALEEEAEVEAAEAAAGEPAGERDAESADEEGGRRRRRRRRRRDERTPGEAPPPAADEDATVPAAAQAEGEPAPAAEEGEDEEDGAEDTAEAAGDDEDQQARRRRRRGRRGGRRRTRREDEGQVDAAPDVEGEAVEPPAPAPVRPPVVLPSNPRDAVEALFEAMEARAEEALRRPAAPEEPAVPPPSAPESRPEAVPAADAVVAPEREPAPEAAETIAAAEPQPVEPKPVEPQPVESRAAEPATAEPPAIALPLVPPHEAPAAEAQPRPVEAIPPAAEPAPPATEAAPAEPPRPPRKGWWQRLVETR